MLLGTFFVLPVYLQVVVGLDAFETGVKLVPMSAMMLVAALLGPRAAARRSPRRVAQVGLVAVAVGRGRSCSRRSTWSSTGYGFAVGIAIIGVGAGLLASQLGNVIMSSVPAARTNEAGGLQGTAQNLGASLGTALIGAILLSGLGYRVHRIASQTNPAVPPELQTALVTYVEQSGLEVIPVATAEQLLRGDAACHPSRRRSSRPSTARRSSRALPTRWVPWPCSRCSASGFTRRLPGSTAQVTLEGAAGEPASGPGGEPAAA